LNKLLRNVVIVFEIIIVIICLYVQTIFWEMDSSIVPVVVQVILLAYMLCSILKLKMFFKHAKLVDLQTGKINSNLLDDDISFGDAIKLTKLETFIIVLHLIISGIIFFEFVVGFQNHMSSFGNFNELFYEEKKYLIWRTGLTIAVIVSSLLSIYYLSVKNIRKP